MGAWEQAIEKQLYSLLRGTGNRDRLASRMVPYILRRMGVMVVVLAAVSVCAFVIIQLPPGDYLDDYIAGLQARGTAVDQAEVEALRHQYGLDRPI